MNQAEASRRIERLEEDLTRIEAEQKKIQELLVKLNAILHGSAPARPNKEDAEIAKHERNL